jgi:glucosylceramidase
MSTIFTGRARAFLTAKDTGARLSEQPDLLGINIDEPSENTRPQGSRIWLDSKKRFQKLQGFGGAFTESAATTWLKLGQALREQVLRDYFDPEFGHGYSFCRVHMGSCDFSLGNYSHVELPDDIQLNSFSIDRDKQALIPFIKAAQKVAPQPIQLLASPWSPPAWMKTNRQMNRGGELRPEFAGHWAQYFVRFIQEYEAQGIPIWGVTVQNEPQANQAWDSCIYSAEQERDFIRDHLGPALEKANLAHVKIVAWDHNRDEMVERVSVIFSDKEASKFVWGTGFHWYVENHFDHVQLVHDAWPDKHLLFTEGCQEGGPHLGDWGLGERYAQSIINDLNRWTVGWIDWNLLLDQTGGPNHVCNLCSAPIIAMTTEDRIEKQSSYDYLGHFSRFIKTGAQRILCAANKEVLECTAFLNPDASIALVVMNRSDREQSFGIYLNTHLNTHVNTHLNSTNQLTWTADLPPRSILTVVFS